MDFLREKQDGHRHRTIDAITKGRRQLRCLIDQSSTYIYVYVDNYQNKIYFLKITKFVFAVN